ncbi:MAG: NUDIX hydrolase [Alphaproteobacteria bacterium]|nr:NUDIX hydrolase [Alphaproteobacteria bacterium]
MSREYPDRPFVGVGVVIWRDDKVLLIQRGKAPRYGSWSLPGGRQKLGETVRETALREVAEETGLAIEIIHLIDVVDAVTHDDDGRVRYHYTLVDFGAEWRDGEAVAGSDAAGVRWVDPNDLDQFALWDETVRIIRLSAARR